MEAVPGLPMLQFPVKYADEAIHFSQVLKQGIRTYYQEDPESYNVEIQALESLRKSVVNAPINFEGCSLLKRYYCQLHSLCSRFPLEKVENLAFNWYFGCDDSGKTNHTGGITYEMNSVMFNIASMHMTMGEDQMRNSPNAPDGMKLACTHYQCAAWSFETLSESRLDDFEITTTGMTYLKNIALSQAQECILQKSMTDNRKPNIIAKVSMQVVEYLKVCQDFLEIVKKQPNYSNLPKFWEAHIKFKMVYHHAMTLFHLGMQSEEQQRVGEKIAYFEAAAEKLTESTKLTKPLEKFNPVWKTKIRDSLTFANDVIQGKLTAAKKENEFVYHEKVPPFATLPDAKGASLVKCIPFSFTDPEVAGIDIFQRLVPIEAHQASSIYSEEKAKLLRQVASQIEERNVELESYLSSMQLDSFAYQNDETLNALPQELVECCADLNSRDAYKELSEAMSLISNAQHEIDMKLGQIQSLIMHEEKQEMEFSMISGTKQPPNQILNELKREVKRCRQAHEAAQDMNKTLHSAITIHKDNIAKLSSSLDSLVASLPSAIVVESDTDVELRQEIQRLMKKIRDMKTQRAEFESQLRNGLQEDDITRELVVNQGNTDELFKQKLQKHLSVVAVLEQNMSAQPNILNALSESNANYAATRRTINQVRRQRSEVIHSLIVSYQAFTNIVEKVENAKDFYSKMETQLNKAFARAKSLCKVQEEQREENLSVNVKRFTGEYNNPSNKHVPGTTKELSRPAGPKLKDYLMAGTEIKTASNVTPSMVPLAPDYSSSSVRPSPLGSELQDNRMNVAGYGPQSVTPQSHLPPTVPYQPPYSQTSPHHAPQPTSGHALSQSNQYQPPRPQSMSYQVPGSQPAFSQVPGNQPLPRQSHVTQPNPYHVTTQQPTTYNISGNVTAPYQTPAPQSSPYATSASQSIQYIAPRSQLSEHHPHGAQMASTTIPGAPSRIYQPTSQQTHHIRPQQANPATQGGQNSVSHPIYNQLNRLPLIGHQVPGSAPAHPGLVAPQNPHHISGCISNYQATPSQAISHQVVAPRVFSPPSSAVTSAISTMSNISLPYKSQSYSAQQTTLSSNMYSAQPTATYTSQPYTYADYSNGGANNMTLNAVPSHSGNSAPRLAYPNNMGQQPFSNASGVNSSSNTAYQMPGYPGQHQEVRPNSTTPQQFLGGTTALRQQGHETPQQHYQRGGIYNPQGNVVYQASTHQTIPQDSYSQKYLQHYSAMQVVGSAANTQSHLSSRSTQIPVSTINTIATGQYANQRYVPSGFGNFPNWSATNTNTLSFNPLTSSISSPNAMPKDHPVFPVGISYTGESTSDSQDKPVPTTTMAPAQPTASLPTESAKETLSNMDLLAGIDISQTMSPLFPQKTSEGGATMSSNDLPDAVKHTVDDLKKLELSAENSARQTDETILAKLAQQPKRSTSTVDPLSAEMVLTNLATETERFSKFVLGLDRKSLNGPTNLELKWKELALSMDQKCTILKISVSRCYPMKNRFADLLPFDETRVVLPSSRDDYINASFVQMKLIENSIPFILTQAPMPNTFADFWSMVWDNQVETVVCLNIEAEVKGQIYYPTKVGTESNCGSFIIALKQVFEATNCSWIRRTFHVTNQETKATRVVLHCQFLTWPPGEMPESPSQFLQFVEEFHDLQKQQRNKMRPSVVHCVSGTGRSGAFVLASAHIQHLNQTGSLCDIWKLIVELCQQRRSALQDKSYLLFLYSAVLYYAQDILMKRGILTDKATFEDNPREKTHVRHPSADLLTSDLSKIKANLGLVTDDSDSLENSEAGVPEASSYDFENVPPVTENSVELDGSDVRIQIGGATLPPNLAASVDPLQLKIDAAIKAPKMTKEEFMNPSAEVQDDTVHPFQELDPLWSHKHS